MNLIVAADDRNGIARAGEIPWRISEDLARFKRLTMGSTVVMGRKTWESLPEKFRTEQGLPGRLNVILTRRPEKVKRPPCVYTIRDIIQLGYLPNDVAFFDRKKAESMPKWIIGGGEIYAEALRLGLVDRIELTRVRGDFGCDTFWPGVPEGWVLTEASDGAETDAGIAYRFETWRKP